MLRAAQRSTTSRPPLKTHKNPQQKTQKTNKKLKTKPKGWLHPTLNQGNLIDEVSGIDTVPNEKKQHKVTAGLSNSFGFGGHNSAVIFAPFEA